MGNAMKKAILRILAGAVSVSISYGLGCAAAHIPELFACVNQSSGWESITVFCAGIIVSICTIADCYFIGAVVIDGLRPRKEKENENPSEQ